MLDVAMAETRKNKSFGTSLLLANRPLSPKIINGSFAAIFDNNDVLFEFAKKLSQFRYGEKDCPGNFLFYKLLGLTMNWFESVQFDETNRLVDSPINNT